MLNLILAASLSTMGGPAADVRLEYDQTSKLAAHAVLRSYQERQARAYGRHSLLWHARPYALAMGADFASTEWFLARSTLTEQNRLPGMQHSLGRAAWTSSGIIGAAYFDRYACRKGHPRIAKGVRITILVVRGYVAVRNVRMAEERRAWARNCAAQGCVR